VITAMTRKTIVIHTDARTHPGTERVWGSSSLSCESAIWGDHTAGSTLVEGQSFRAITDRIDQFLPDSSEVPTKDH